jgi:[acyl-carrier-protein] S-malonyltransferase
MAPAIHVFMFPGQSSIDPQMMRRALRINPLGTALLARASEILQRDLVSWLADPAGVAFTSNRQLQVGVFLATQMHLDALAAHGIFGDCSLGLSLGEYSHLVHIGALDFADALRLVDRRGELYDAGPSGCMVSVFPVEIEAVDDAVRRASAHGVVEISNYNSPTQHVLAGDAKAVESAAQLLEDEHSAHVVTIERRIPMHCSRFSSVAEAFRPHLAAASWKAPRRAYLPNVDGSSMESATQADFVRCLSEHVHRPVRWRSSIEQIAARCPEAVFVEVGPRNVLHNMLSKRWLPVPRLRTDDDVDPVATFAATVGALRHAD